MLLFFFFPHLHLLYRLNPSAFISTYGRNKILNKYEENSDEDTTYSRRVKERHNDRLENLFEIGLKLGFDVSDNESPKKRNKNSRNDNSQSYYTPQKQRHGKELIPPHSWPIKGTYRGILLRSWCGCR